MEKQITITEREKKIIKKFSRDILYKITLQRINDCSEYCLTNANDNKEIYAIFEQEPIID